MTSDTTRHPQLTKALLVLAALLAVVLGMGAWWLTDYRHADAYALSVAADEDGAADGVAVRALDSGALAFEPLDASSDIGFILYPGGKVQAEAYAPLLRECARRGILCCLVRPPLNLAFFDMDAAARIQAEYPAVDRWLVGGHSMGGVVASIFAIAHESDCDGLVLLASYPHGDLGAYQGEVLSLIGTNDQVIDPTTYAESRSRLPRDAVFGELEGGNHAQFGNYGEQEGDGIATMSREEQQRRTAEAIAEMASDGQPT